MEQLNRLTRSLRRARTVELPDGERDPGAAGPRGALCGSWGDARVHLPGLEGAGPRPPWARAVRSCCWKKQDSRTSLRHSMGEGVEMQPDGGGPGSENGAVVGHFTVVPAGNRDVPPE